ncbi:MAG: OmpH family outer membrane protein [Blastocatellia bacterium]|nr:OmpH family outer membrane protein [Blastocatellia bacterium]
MLILVLPSGGELVTASSAAEPPLSMQTGSTPAPRIAVVDTERIITSSKAGRAVTTALEQFGKQVQTDLGAMQTEVRDLRRGFRRRAVPGMPTLRRRCRIRLR